MRYATILFKTSLLHYNYYTSVPAFLLQSLGQAVSLRFCLRNGFDVGKLGVGLRHDAEIGQFFPRLRCDPGSARPASRRNCPANRRGSGFPSGPRPHAAPAAFSSSAVTGVRISGVMIPPCGILANILYLNYTISSRKSQGNVS